MRNAEANHGLLHFEILKLAVQHDDLASVWPAFEPGPPADLNWHASSFARTSLTAGSHEFTFAQKVDEICREFEAVAATAAASTKDGLRRTNSV